MAANADVGVARDYHDRTAHSPASVRSSTHTLEWDIKPFPFKVYTDPKPIPLPRAFDPLSMSTLAALAGGAPPSADTLTLTELAALLYYSAGVTKKLAYPGGGEVLFRAAPSTGALYQTEVYVAVGRVDDIAPGLYHFCPGDFALRCLRESDVRWALARAAADPTLATRAVTIVLSAIYWRNTWKYQARGYRHLFWDSGTLLANLVTCAGALGRTPGLYAGFADADVNHLLGVDPGREAALELVALGPEGLPSVGGETLGTSNHVTLPLSTSEVDYPLLDQMHRASMLATQGEVRAWRQARAPTPRRATPPLIPLPPPRQSGGRGLGETIQRRGSTRQFSHVSLAAEDLATALWAATRVIDADIATGVVDLYLIVNAVDGIPSGAYCYWRDAHGLEPLTSGDFRRESAYLCLEQALGGDAAAVIYFLAPLDDILESFGNRGYRLANLDAGLAGGRAYLAAYALGFGASGLTFYDREVVEFFSPHAAGRDAIFVTALGRSVRRA